MYDLGKIKLLQKVLIAFGAIVVAAVAFSLGGLVKSTQVKQATKPKQVTVVTQSKQLSEATIKKFLIAYYTKKDLGENRDRYKPLMTEAMYNQETAQEDLPVNQAYKGYTINQVFDKATIYIDESNLTAICEVDYHNTQLSEKGTDKAAATDTPVKDTIQLSFTKDGKSYKVNNLTHVFLTKSTDNAASNSYAQ